MEAIVSTLSEIEQTAISIINHTEVAKREYEEEIQSKKRAFDEELSQKTEVELSKIKNDMQKTLDHDLNSLKVKSQQTILSVEQEYRLQNEAYATQIFNRIIGG